MAQCAADQTRNGEPLLFIGALGYLTCISQHGTSGFTYYLFINYLKTTTHKNRHAVWAGRKAGNLSIYYNSTRIMLGLGRRWEYRRSKEMKKHRVGKMRSKSPALLGFYEINGWVWIEQEAIWMRISHYKGMGPYGARGRLSWYAKKINHASHV